MPVTTDDRHDLHADLTDAIGRSSATTLMELLPPVGWDDLATKHDLDHQTTVLGHQTTVLRHDLEQQTSLLRRDLEHLRAGTRKDLDHHAAVHRAELHAAFNQLRSEMHAGFGEMQTETAQLREEMRVGFAEGRAYVDRVLRDQNRIFVMALVGLTTGLGSSLVAVLTAFVR